ncbi:VOC family protein [Patescibacteria group bacterium]|nr:VOC family protein [Patescibacteria group bacterium]
MNLDSAIFYSHDIQKVIPFYLDILGFTLDYQNERFVSFQFPNGAKLGIKNQTDEREQPGFQTVFIEVEGIEEVYRAIQGKGIQIYKELIEKPWGKEFSILDPDENKVLYIERIKEKS